MEIDATINWQISTSPVHLGFVGVQPWAPELARMHRTGIVKAWTASNYGEIPRST